MEDAGRNWAFTCAICLITLLAACRTTQPTALDRPSTPTRAPLHRIFLLGNTNGSTDEPALQLLSDQLNEAGENSTVIFLGDNAEGLPDSTDADRAGAEHTLRTQLDLLKDFPGRILYIPGEREWHQGPEALARLEAFIETNLDRGNTFLPDGGSPGPV